MFNSKEIEFPDYWINFQEGEKKFNRNQQNPINCLNLKKNNLSMKKFQQFYRNQSLARIWNISGRNIIIENFLNGKIYRINFKKQWEKVENCNSFFFFVSGNRIMKFDITCGEVVNIFRFNKNKKHSEKIKFLKDKNLIFLSNEKLILFDIKKKKKISEIGNSHKIKFMALYHNVYVINAFGKILILEKDGKVLPNLITINFRNDLNFNLKRLVGSKSIALITKIKKNQVFIFFFRKLKNTLFLRNPISFGFKVLPNSIEISSKNRCLFIIFKFLRIRIPIKLILNNLKHSTVKQNSHRLNSNYIKKYTSQAKQLKKLHENKITIKTSPPVCKKKINLGLLFKKFKTTNVLTTGDHRNLIEMIETFSKFKIYKKSLFKNLCIKNIKTFGRDIPTSILNPFLNFVFKNALFQKKKFFEDILTIREIFWFYLLPLQNNKFLKNLITAVYQIQTFKNLGVFLIKVYSSFFCLK